MNFASTTRPPLLLIAASEDRTCTPSMVRAMHRKQSRAASRTDIRVFPGRSHWLIAEPGWDEVAVAAIEWAEANTSGGV